MFCFSIDAGRRVDCGGRLTSLGGGIVRELRQPCRECGLHQAAIGGSKSVLGTHGLLGPGSRLLLGGKGADLHKQPAASLTPFCLAHAMAGRRGTRMVATLLRVLPAIGTVAGHAR
jgi:hypothetical protein